MKISISKFKVSILSLAKAGLNLLLIFRVNKLAKNIENCGK